MKWLILISSALLFAAVCFLPEELFTSDPLAVFGSLAVTCGLAFLLYLKWNDTPLQRKQKGGADK